METRYVNMVKKIYSYPLESTEDILFAIKDFSQLYLDDSRATLQLYGNDEYRFENLIRKCHFYNPILEKEDFYI